MTDYVSMTAWKRQQIGLGVSRCPSGENDPQFLSPMLLVPPYNPDDSLIGYMEAGQKRIARWISK